MEDLAIVCIETEIEERLSREEKGFQAKAVRTSHKVLESKGKSTPSDTLKKKTKNEEVKEQLQETGNTEAQKGQDFKDFISVERK